MELPGASFDSRRSNYRVRRTSPVLLCNGTTRRSPARSITRRASSLSAKTMRQSVASSRSSHIPGQAPNAAATARLTEKKKEFEAVSAFDRASAMFLKRIEGLADDCDVMADAGMGTVCSVQDLSALLLLTSPVCGALQCMGRFWHSGRRCFAFSTLIVCHPYHYHCRLRLGLTRTRNVLFSCFSRAADRRRRRRACSAADRRTPRSCAHRGAPARRTTTFIVSIHVPLRVSSNTPRYYRKEKEKNSMLCRRGM